LITALKDGKKAGTVAFGAAKADAAGKLFAQRDGLVVIVDDRVIENLSKEFSAFRENKVLPIDSWTVTRFTIEMDQFRTGGEKVEGLWRSTGRRVPTGIVEDFLDRIGRLESKAFVGKKDYPSSGIPVPKKGATVPVLCTIEIREERSSTPRSLTFLSASPVNSQPMVAVEVTGRSDAMLVERGAMDELRTLAQQVRDSATAEPTPRVVSPTPSPATPAAAAPATR
jgi:hypothetical protein